jgi:hypothetical protein
MTLRLLIGKFGREKVDDCGEQTPSENNEGCTEAPEAAGVKSVRIPIGVRAGDSVATRSVERDVLLRQRNRRLDVIRPVSVDDDLVNLSVVFALAHPLDVTAEAVSAILCGAVDEGRGRGRSACAESSTKTGPIDTDSATAIDAKCLLRPIVSGGDGGDRGREDGRLRISVGLIKGKRATAAAGGWFDGLFVREFPTVRRGRHGHVLGSPSGRRRGGRRCVKRNGSSRMGTAWSPAGRRPGYHTRETRAR